MAFDIELRADLELGVVPTHLKFVGGLVPDDDGRFPRGADGKLVVVSNMAALMKASRVKITSCQIPFFPGIAESEVDELVGGLKELGLIIHFIMMVGGADPMNPADEDTVVEMLKNGLKAAKKYGVKNVASTSIEEWMQGKPKTGKAFEEAIAQNVKLHARAVREAEVQGAIDHWHIEFLRSGEMQTFTDASKCWQFVKAANEEMGTDFFKVLVDAAHCGDSELSLEENEAAIAEMAEGGGLGIYHASSPTTRGCLSTDDGWIAALLKAAAKTGKLKIVFVEMFHHEDEALQPLRDLVPGHGIDTTDGRTYDACVLEGLEDVARRINNLVARGDLA